MPRLRSVETESGTSFAWQRPLDTFEVEIRVLKQPVANGSLDTSTLQCAPRRQDADVSRVYRILPWVRHATNRPPTTPPDARGQTHGSARPMSCP